MMKSKLLGFVGVGAAITASTGSAEAQKNTKPNVIIILADDIGWGDLSCYGEKTISTPNVDAIASSGIRFTDAHATASTSTPSRYSLLTGMYAFRRNDTGIAPGDASMIIKPNQTTIADIFKQKGYSTGAVGKWHLGLGAQKGQQNWNGVITPGLNDLGFDYSYIMAATGDRVPCVFVENQRIVSLDPNDPISVSYSNPFPGEPTGKSNPELVYKQKPSHGHDQAIINGISRIGYMTGGKSALWVDEYIADSLTTKAVKFIDNNKDTPFFLYFATNDIHVPRYPDPRFVGKSGMGPRGDAILQFDWSVGEIIKALKKNGLTENTLIILTSDNGPVVDDGYKDQAVELLGSHRPAGPYRGGKYSNFEAGTRVPFLVKWPGNVKPGVSKALVSHVDMLASLATLIGATYDSDQATDSKSHIGSYLGKDRKGRSYIIEQSNGLSITTGEWKYITPNNGNSYDTYTSTELGNSKEEQLYNLKRDRGEKNNVATRHPKIVEDLKKKIAIEEAKH